MVLPGIKNKIPRERLFETYVVVLVNTLVQNGGQFFRALNAY